MTIYHLAEKFMFHLKRRGLSPSTVKGMSGQVRAFARYLERQGIRDISEVTLQIVRAWHRDTYWRSSSRGRPCTPHTVATRIYTLRSFFRFLLAEGHVLMNPALHLPAPRLSRLPRAILSITEVAALLSQPDLKRFEGLRDRAMLELFYSTGIRRGELMNLDIQDVDLREGTLFIRCGKGAKDRVVPLGEGAIFHLGRYLAARKAIAPGEKALFVSPFSRKRICYNTFDPLAGEYARRAGIKKPVSCHTLRHTCAVHMLEGGADLRSIQELLGHRSIKSTEIYLSVSREELKKVHKKSHPRGNFPLKWE